MMSWRDGHVTASTLSAKAESRLREAYRARAVEAAIHHTVRRARKPRRPFARPGVAACCEGLRRVRARRCERDLWLVIRNGRQQVARQPSVPAQALPRRRSSRPPRGVASAPRLSRCRPAQYHRLEVASPSHAASDDESRRRCRLGATPSARRAASRASSPASAVSRAAVEAATAASMARLGRQERPRRATANACCRLAPVLERLCVVFSGIARWCARRRPTPSHRPFGIP